MTYRGHLPLYIYAAYQDTENQNHHNPTMQKMPRKKKAKQRNEPAQRSKELPAVIHLPIVIFVSVLLALKPSADPQ
jgi:hypothetical protein